MSNWPIDLDRSLVFDTGFSGTIWAAICRVSQKSPQLLLLSGKNQIFPKHSGSRQKALAIEYMPKYWQSGRVEDDAPAQYLSRLDEFVKAAILTIWLWHHVSPRRVHKRRVTGPNMRIASIPSVSIAGTATEATNVAWYPNLHMTSSGAATSVTGDLVMTNSTGFGGLATDDTTSLVMGGGGGGGGSGGVGIPGFYPGFQSAKNPVSVIPITTPILKDKEGNPITG
jgi:hypothetical protein